MSDWRELFAGLDLPENPPPRSEFQVMTSRHISIAALELDADVVWPASERFARRYLDRFAWAQGRLVDPDSVIRHHAIAFGFSGDAIAHSILGPDRTRPRDPEDEVSTFQVVWLAQLLQAGPIPEPGPGSIVRDGAGYVWRNTADQPEPGRNNWQQRIAGTLAPDVESWLYVNQFGPVTLVHYSPMGPT